MDHRNADWLAHVSRAPFLLLTPSCILLGAATASASGTQVSAGRLGLVLLGGVLAHAAVNAFNEYADSRSGLDRHTQRTPFSGGSGFLPAHPEYERATLALGVAALLACVAIGIVLMRASELALFGPGLAGVVLVTTYSLWLVRHASLAFIAPGLGFGPIMVVGTHVALGGTPGVLPWLASVTPFCLTSGLLLLNQFPDVEADARVGRRHLPLVIGRRLSARVFALLQALAFLAPLASVAVGAMPRYALLVLALAPVAAVTAAGVLRRPNDIVALLPHMARNVLVSLLAPVLLAVGTRLGGR